MVQVMSASTLTASRSNGVRGSTHLLGKHFRLMKKSHVTFGFERPCLWYHSAQSSSCLGHSYILREQSMRIEAGWFFKGGDQGLDARSEHSESANVDILIFFLHLNLATQVQRALNLEEYGTAQQLRNKLTELETEVIKQQEARRGSASKSEAQDIAISILHRRADLQNAIQGENYALAAEIRDEISKLESESLVHSAKAQLYENAQYAFRLGQKVRHKMFGYRGVVCGMDPFCCESSSWKESSRVEKLSRGAEQPFYQVLVDVGANPNILVAYVPEEKLLAPDEPDMEMFDHPYISFLFYGMDAAGDFIPIKQLREKYNKPRYEVPSDPPEENGEND
ncbi:clp protease adapter protein ClpF, chloroplastic-like [Actinidia eriantha]|uniref:clp protease adapter protein ClpF, chloroplastic-like n=1 Tax=Actinidia eriantha TaxID=165200 RepID=UPI002591128D|nr:clp protease adapter protein ClpF, chloroplastic-like [Actinidia eriantha]XP_057484960.1 clp protease adapter protein ClpF, chloroplastic-like [Actinidia eriantha]XP_057484961.1 clp protease adapter protein ClpF, chloroplastic-like [Actinidia eriantha]